MVDIPGPIVFRPRTDQQHADGRITRLRFHDVGIRQAATNAYTLRTLEQIPVLVVNQLPRQSQ